MNWTMYLVLTGIRVINQSLLFCLSDFRVNFQYLY